MTDLRSSPNGITVFLSVDADGNTANVYAAKSARECDKNNKREQYDCRDIVFCVESFRCK